MASMPLVGQATIAGRWLMTVSHAGMLPCCRWVLHSH